MTSHSMTSPDVHTEMTQMAVDTPGEVTKRGISMKVPPVQPTKRGISMKVPPVQPAK